MKREILSMLAMSAILIAGESVKGGNGNKFEFDKTVYNLAREKETEIRVTEDKGYKFSGKSKAISGNSKIKGTTVNLRLSQSKEDTQVTGFFIPTGEIPSEKEMWVNSQKVTVIEHYIKSATYRLKGSRIREFTIYYATVIARPDKLGEPKVTVLPAGFTEPVPMRKLHGGGNEKYNYDFETGGHRAGGKVFSTFLNDKASAECVKVGGKK